MNSKQSKYNVVWYSVTCKAGGLPCHSVYGCFKCWDVFIQNPVTKCVIKKYMNYIKKIKTKNKKITKFKIIDIKLNSAVSKCLYL